MGCFKIVEGFVKYRVGRRWKQRWCILQKLSPVSNCVHLCLHKGGQPQSSHPEQPSAVYALEDFCGIDVPFQWDHEQHVMAVVCRQHVVILALADKSTLDAWCLAIRCHLGCDHRFLVDIAKAPVALKQTTRALLFVHGPLLCLTTRSSQSTGPPSILASWTVFDLRRFGVLESKFCFQVNDVGSLSVYALSSVSATEIDRLMREATRKRSTSISSERVDGLDVSDELNTCHRRSSHTGTSSLDSSSIYALLNFDSSPENGCTDYMTSDRDSLTVPVSRLRPACCKDGIHVGKNVKYQCKKETDNEAHRTSFTGLVSAVPNQYVDSLSSAVGKKQLIISLPDAETSKRVQSKTSEDKCLSVKDKLSVCNGLMSLLSAGSDDTVLPTSSDKVLLHHDAAQAEQCPEISRRRYSCGDQLAATWWRLLDHAASFSDLRGLPGSLSRFCCSTWRTFTGVKSQCIDVSKVGNVGPLQPSETSRPGVDASDGVEIMEQSVSPWWHKPVSPDRRRLIEIGSDIESSSVCEDSPNKVGCNRVLLDNAQNLCETGDDSQLSDSDGAGSYVSLRVNCKSSGTCHKVAQAAHCGKNLPRHCHSNCDILEEDDSLFAVVEHPAKQTINKQERAQRQTGDRQKMSPAASISICDPSVHVSQSSEYTICSCTAVQPSCCGPAIVPCQSSTHSLSSGRCLLTQSNQLLQSNNGYINLSLGVQPSSLDRQSVTNSTYFSHERPAEISTETKSVPNLGNDCTVSVDSFAVHAPCSSGKETLSCDSSLSLEEPLTDKFSRKSSNRLLRLIRRSSAKAHKQPAFPVTYSAVAGECNMDCTDSPVVVSAGSVSVTVTTSAADSDHPPNVHRLPSPNVPPPPVPDDSATSRLFQLCHTSFSEHSPMNVSLDSDPLSQYEDLSVVRSCSAAKRSTTLSSSYSAGDKRYYDSQSLKSSMNEDSMRMLTRIPSHRQRHVRQSSLELVYQPRCGSDRSEVMSVQSVGSDSSVPVRLSTSDTTRHYSSSSTSTRLRPRYGTEYQRIERRLGVGGVDVVDDCSTSSSTPQPSPYSVASSSVFTFDNCSCDGDEPPPPLPARARRPEPTYVNIAPHARSASDVEVNYAEIDLSGTTDDRHRLRTREPTEPTPYAVIDLEATAAAAQTGREHARLREGLLQAKSIRRSDVTAPKAATLGRYSRPRTPRKSSMPSNVYETSLFDITRWPSILSDESGDSR